VLCSVLNCVAVCCSVWQLCCSHKWNPAELFGFELVAADISYFPKTHVLPCVAVCCRVLPCVVVRRGALLCVAVSLHCVAVCCSLLQCVALCCSREYEYLLSFSISSWLAADIFSSRASASSLCLHTSSSCSWLICVLHCDAV